MKAQAHNIKIINNQSPGIMSNLNPLAMLKSLWQARWLLIPLARRQLAVRYKGSHLGFLWTLLNPLALLAIYTFVFSVVLQARWPRGSEGAHGEFALALFAGLIPFNFLSEALQATPNIISANRTYIKKMAFPLEILPLVGLGPVLVQSLCSVLILLAGIRVILGPIPSTALVLPLVYFPLMLLSMGLCWFIAAVGVYVRDTAHILNIGLLMLFFLTPIFYPISAIPQAFRAYAHLNPLCLLVESFRNAAVWGSLPGPWIFCLICLASLVICQAGYAFFMARKNDFADLV
ncbi:MAG: ABC transporter permease [Desulfatibacillum sp.]|nr:ABC transporter permease [Desulfatibacillum sp.]